MLWRYLRLASPLFERAGYFLTPQWRLDEAILSATLKNLFKSREIDCVLDVGANRGQFRDFLRNEVSYAGPILSFEPVRHLAEVCSARAKTDPAWHLFEMALGNSETEAPIHVTKLDVLSSFLTPLRSAQPFDKGSDIVSSELVKVRTLNSVFPELQAKFGFRRPYLKLDTQGFDLAVIEGADLVLSYLEAVQTELSVIPLYEGMPTWTTVISALKDRGFDVAGLVPVNRDKGLRVLEFDGIFIRTPSASAVT